ncbi:hypothetical protein vseg_006355 [Gypsophila vaccaria]
MTSKLSMKTVVLLIIVAVAHVGVSDSASTPACLTNISNNCNTDGSSGDTSTEQLDNCCTAVNGAVKNQRKCFCLMKPYLDDPSSADSITALFTYCGIEQTLDDLCPSTDGSTTTSPSDDDTSPATDDSSTTSTIPSTTTGSSSNTASGLGGGILGQGKKEANKAATTTSFFGLFIVTIGLVITHGF